MKSTTVFLIHLLLWLSLILAGTPVASATMMPNQQVQAVQALEDTLFAVHYDQEPLNARIGRLEETVFGQTQTGTNLEARITKLQSSLSPKALGPLSPTAKAAAPNNAPAAQNNTQPANQPIASANTQPFGNQGGYASNTANSGKLATPLPQKVSSPKGNTKSSTSNLNQIQGGGKPAPSVQQANPTTASAPEPGETDYPTVSQMELKQFGKTFAKEDISQRLTRLETQVFKVPQTGSLSDRTDNLRLVVLGDTGQAQPPMANQAYGGPNSAPNTYYGLPYAPPGATSYPQPPNYGAYGDPMPGYSSPYGPAASATPYGAPPQAAYNSMPYSAPPGSYGVPPNAMASASPGAGGMAPNMPAYGSPGYMPNASEPTPDMMAAISEVEKEVLGNTYPSEPINTRLDRVENKVFKATSPEMNPQDRIQRVIAVASAGGAPMTGKAKAKSTFQTLLPIIMTILPLILL